MSKSKELNPSERLMAIDPENYKKAVENSRNPGTALVTVRDLAKCQHILASIAELFIIDNDITKEKLDQLFLRSVVGTTNQAAHTKANLRKQLVQPKVSWDLLEHFLRACGYDISDVTLTLVSRDDNHEVRKISFSDRRKYVEDKFKPSISSRVEI